MYPAIVICPGGAYACVSEREGEPVAKKFFAAGYSTFILAYSVQENAKDYGPLRQLAATVDCICTNAVKLQINRECVAVCGFSAGGHLAASLGVLHNDEAFLRAFAPHGKIRPDAMILGYPVITSDEFTHWDTLRNVSGGASKESR